MLLALMSATRLDYKCTYRQHVHITDVSNLPGTASSLSLVELSAVVLAHMYYACSYQTMLFLHKATLREAQVCLRPLPL